MSLVMGLAFVVVVGIVVVDWRDAAGLRFVYPSLTLDLVLVLFLVSV